MGDSYECSAPIVGATENATAYRTGLLDDLHRSIRVYAHACSHDTSNVGTAASEIESLLVGVVTDRDEAQAEVERLTEKRRSGEAEAPVAWLYYEDNEYIRTYWTKRAAASAAAKFGGVYERSAATPLANAAHGGPTRYFVCDPYDSMEYVDTDEERAAGIRERLRATSTTDGQRRSDVAPV